jgi:hypothetical protein
VRLLGIALIAAMIFVGCSNSNEAGIVPDLPVATPTPIDYVNSLVKKGRVDDQDTAIAIAVQAWVPVYGKERIERERPYTAVLKNGIWTVAGSLPYQTPGGVAIALINQKDGHVIKLMHEE